MGGLLILISVVTGTVAFISLIRPLPRFWLPTRKRAALVWIVSFVLLFIGAALSPNRDVLGLTAREDEELALAQLRPLIDQMHEIGEQRKQEYEAALDWFKAAARAAVQGHGSYTAALAEGEAVLALAQLRPLIDQMHEIGEQRKQEYEAALDWFKAAARAAVQGHGSYTAALAEGEAVLALATEIVAEMLALATELADLEATAPPEVAALAATNRVVMEQAFAVSESAAARLQEQVELLRALVAELNSP